MEFFNVAQELPHLIGLRLATDILQVQRPIRQRMFINVVAAADTIQTVAECLREAAQLLKANVVRSGQHFIQELAFAAHNSTSTTMMLSPANTLAIVAPAVPLPHLSR